MTLASPRRGGAPHLAAADGGAAPPPHATNTKRPHRRRTPTSTQTASAGTGGVAGSSRAGGSPPSPYSALLATPVTRHETNLDPPLPKSWACCRTEAPVNGQREHSPSAGHGPTPQKQAAHRKLPPPKGNFTSAHSRGEAGRAASTPRSRILSLIQFCVGGVSQQGSLHRGSRPTGPRLTRPAHEATTALA